MPNRVVNEIIFKNVSPTEVCDILPLVLGKTGHVDFELLVPPPLNIWWGSVGIEHEAAFAAGTMLDWAVVNWGTKCNAYAGEPPKFENGELTLVFRTAWNTPRGWLCALFNATKISFECRWLSEGCCTGQVESFTYGSEPADWIEWKQTPIEDKTDLHRHLHTLLHGVPFFEDEENEAADNEVSL